jgi:hypothetical protein
MFWLRRVGVYLLSTSSPNELNQELASHVQLGRMSETYQSDDNASSTSTPAQKSTASDVEVAEGDEARAAETRQRET